MRILLAQVLFFCDHVHKFRYNSDSSPVTYSGGGYARASCIALQKQLALRNPAALGCPGWTFLDPPVRRQNDSLDRFLRFSAMLTKAISVKENTILLVFLLGSSVAPAGA